MSIGNTAIGTDALGDFSSQSTNPDVTVGLVGRVVTFTQGSVGATVAGNAAVNLVSNTATFTAGNLGVSLGGGSDVTFGLTGQTVTFSTGKLLPRRFGRSGNVIIVPEN